MSRHLLRLGFLLQQLRHYDKDDGVDPTVTVVHTQTDSQTHLLSQPIASAPHTLASKLADSTAAAAVAAAASAPTATGKAVDDESAVLCRRWISASSSLLRAHFTPE